MVAICCVISAAIFKSCGDKTETTIAFKTSVFSKFNPGWWCKPISAHKVGFLPFTRYRLDFWHLCMSGMICSFIGLIFSSPITPYKLVDYILLGGLYNIVFNTFYNHVLNKESKFNVLIQKLCQQK